jgi:hypothetical protein
VAEAAPFGLLEQSWRRFSERMGGRRAVAVRRRHVQPGRRRRLLRGVLQLAAPVRHGRHRPFAESEITGGSYTRADPVSLGPWQSHRLPAAAPVTETPFTGAGPWLMVELPPSTRIRLRLNIRLRTRVP